MQELETVVVSEGLARLLLRIGQLEVPWEEAAGAGPDDECPAGLARGVAACDPEVEVGLGAVREGGVVFTQPGKESAGELGLEAVSGGVRR